MVARLGRWRWVGGVPGWGWATGRGPATPPPSPPGGSWPIGPAGAGGEPSLNLLRGLSGRVHARAIACELTMDHAPIVTPPAARSRPIWQRPVSRRSVLATGAAGATAAVLAALW